MNAQSLEQIIENIAFRPCARCDQLTPNGIVCFDCQSAYEATFDAGRDIAIANRSIPRRYSEALYGNATTLRERVKTPGAVALSESALDAERVVLLGPAGCGKTTLAVAMLRGWMMRTKTPGLFVDAYRLGTARAQHGLGDGDAPMVDAAIASRYLVLDDLGGEQKTVTNAVPDVVFARHAEMRPTVITTGHDVASLRAMYGDGIARRIFEGARVIRLDGVKP